MLRITDILEMTADGRAAWRLRLEGRLQGDWVGELRRCWLRVRSAAAGAPIRVELRDIRFVDGAGKVLLAEMYRYGVEILACDGLTAAIRDEIVAACTPNRRG